MIRKKGEYTLTVYEATIQTAKMGGYLARKGDGPAGIKTLWAGFQKLNNIVSGILMERERSK